MMEENQQSRQNMKEMMLASALMVLIMIETVSLIVMMMAVPVLQTATMTQET